MFSHSFLKRFKLNYFANWNCISKALRFKHNNGSSDSNRPIFSSIDCNPLMTPFASVFQRMLWLVLVSFLSDYKTLPAFHPSEHTQVNEDEKKVHQISSLCPEFVPPTVFTAMRKRPTLDFLSKTWYSLCLYAMCPWVCTARDFAPAIRPCHLSLSVYGTWFCPCYASLSFVPECVLHVILSLLYVPVTCPWVCTARDFVPAIRPCHLSLSVYCTWFCPCYTSLSLVPECVLHVILPLLYVPFYLPQGVYFTWFRPCYTSLLPVPVCVLHVILPLLYVPVACPCVCTARDFVANTHCFDMSLRHEPSFFLVSTKPLWHHLSFFWSILVRAEARFITHDVGECKEVTPQVVNYIKYR